jgi:hypothetical protein
MLRRLHVVELDHQSLSLLLIERGHHVQSLLAQKQELSNDGLPIQDQNLSRSSLRHTGNQKGVDQSIIGTLLLPVARIQSRLRKAPPTHQTTKPLNPSRTTLPKEKSHPDNTRPTVGTQTSLHTIRTRQSHMPRDKSNPCSKHSLGVQFICVTGGELLSRCS